MTLALQRSDTTLSVRVISSTRCNLTIDASLPDFRCAGMATFEMDDAGHLECKVVMVNEAHRKMGIATALFDFAEQHFQRTVTAGANMTPSLLAFYQARDMAIPADKNVCSFAELFSAS